ncbi:phytanoyl-CoA dioxygenase family protein [Herminiimonas sp. KBW02]|uniref:phytanoyl-CoA dioxygenase family protein n=1 Tax=Herminiimonas sp. KBW02 TaxID=2153363 RepID=UPI0013153291|nr:phytanoyl-CoA dioxygenase family protein [Herminiimonas sp. KBW02]
MLNQEQKTEFHKNGYLLVESVFTTEESAKLRLDLMNIFDSDSTFEGDENGGNGSRSTRNNLWTRYPQLRWLMEHKKFIACIKSIAGDDAALIPEMGAHKSGYGGWHKDTGSQESRGHMFQWERDFLMFNAAIYLQENGSSGGGLDVVPGSHNEPDKIAGRPNFWKKLQQKALQLGLIKSIKPYNPSGYSIPNKVGDLVLFNFRIVHRSTPHAGALPETTKYALFFACSANNEHAISYTNYIRTRSGYKYFNDNPLYTDEVKAIASSCNLRLVE